MMHAVFARKKTEMKTRIPGKKVALINDMHFLIELNKLISKVFLCPEVSHKTVHMAIS